MTGPGEDEAFECPMSEAEMAREHEAIKHIVFEHEARAEVEGLDPPAESLSEEILRAIQQHRGLDGGD